MPSVEGDVEYLKDLELYKKHKPYFCLLPPQDGFDPDSATTSNLEWETHRKIRFHDIREEEEPPKLEICGFQVASHTPKSLQFETVEQIQQYKQETASFLRDTLGAVFTYCYDARLRSNTAFAREEYDLNDPLLKEGPARGAHVDITYKSGPDVIKRYLSTEEKKLFLKPHSRVRIINTWRTLIPELEDRPLALLDMRSVAVDDLVAADRIVPDNVGEVYYVTYNPNHKWFWLEKQTPAELFLFVSYDTRSGNHARFCPHVSFANSRCPAGATPRESIETRTIVITTE